MTEKHVLLKFADNWADEMDVEGFLVVTEAHWAERQAAIQAQTSELSLSIGTNEALEWADGEELLACIEVRELSEAETQVLASTFGLQSFENEHAIAGHGVTGFLDEFCEGAAY